MTRALTVTAQIVCVGCALFISFIGTLGIGLLGYWDNHGDGGYLLKIRFSIIMVSPVLLLPLVILAYWRPKQRAPLPVLLCAIYLFAIGMNGASRLVLGVWACVGILETMIAVSQWLPKHNASAAGTT